MKHQPADGDRRKSTKGVGRSTNDIGDSGLGQLLASDTLAVLLKLFMLNPENSYYQRELADAVDVGLYAVQRELARLERTGLVSKTRRGNRVYYRADRTHPAFEDLKRAVLKTMGLGDALRAALAPLGDRVRVAFVYGSCATGRETAESDIDLLLVGELPPPEAATVMGPLSRELGREFNPTIYGVEEFKRKAADGHHFVTEVLKGPKVFLIGSEDELAELLD